MREFLHGYIICDDQLRGEVPEQREWVGGFSSEVGFSPRELYKARRVIYRWLRFFWVVYKAVTLADSISKLEKWKLYT